MKHKNIAYIHVSRLLSNYRSILRLTRGNAGKIGAKPPRVIAVVKADAYGHDVAIVSRALGDAGCDFFAVSSEEEAVQLRLLEEQNSRHPTILVLSRVAPENVSDMIKYDITVALTSEENALSLAAEARRLGERLRAHVKLDTGMNRVGFDVREGEEEKIAEEIAALYSDPGLSVDGIFTHFSAADDELMDGCVVPGYDADGGYTRMQLRRFRRIVELLRARGIEPGVVHAANSAAILCLPEAYFDAVRAGIILYGLMPDSKNALSGSLSPVMQLTSTVTHLHEVKKGERISYGAGYVAERDMLIATIAAGYADGFERAYTGCTVEIGGVRYKQVGRICMDQFMADVTDAPAGREVRVGDEAVLFGGDGGESINDLARRAGTINYEVVCKVSKRVTRRGV